MTYEELVAHIIAIRKEKNIGPVEFAKQIQISRTHLFHIETLQKKASDEILQKMCNSLDINLTIIPKKYII